MCFFLPQLILMWNEVNKCTYKNVVNIKRENPSEAPSKHSINITHNNNNYTPRYLCIKIDS